MVDLVLTDVVMPHINGCELAQRLAEREPGLPVLFMSGYTGDEIMQRGLMLAGAPCIQKPLTQQALTVAVRDRLDRARQAVG
jgi:FixJ family two-component response regulator